LGSSFYHTMNVIPVTWKPFKQLKEFLNKN